jgi:TIR domain/Pentapeptide repeats (8 copies)
MANKEHLARLQQGLDAWLLWRKDYPDIVPDLRGAHLSEARFRGIDLRKVNLSRADLHGADLFEAILRGTDLRGANLAGTDLRGADLRGADLRGADLREAILSQAYLHWAHLAGARIAWTIFGDTDLSTTSGLKTVRHIGPSTIGIDTVYRSQGNIPEVFLRGAGIPDDFIIYIKSLVGQPFQYYSCFISYSSNDEALAQRLHADLQHKGVRCWFAPEDLKIGDEIRSRIDESIQVYDRLLLILSEHSVKSRWVQKEVETAFEKERKENRIVLFPIRIDEAVMRSTVGWAADIRRQRHIGDFRQWKDHDAYQQAFVRLLRDLKADI